MKVTKNYCDRCGKELKFPFNFYGWRAEINHTEYKVIVDNDEEDNARVSIRYRKDNYDLCSKCNRDLSKFLKGKITV